MPDKKDGKRTKTIVRYEVRYRCPKPDQAPYALTRRERLNADNDDDARAQFKRFKRKAESCSSFKLFKVSTVVKSYLRKRVVMTTEECLANDTK